MQQFLINVTNNTEDTWAVTFIFLKFPSKSVQDMVMDDPEINSNPQKAHYN